MQVAGLLPVAVRHRIYLPPASGSRGGLSGSSATLSNGSSVVRGRVFWGQRWMKRLRDAILSLKVPIAEMYGLPTSGIYHVTYGRLARCQTRHRNR